MTEKGHQKGRGDQISVPEKVGTLLGTQFTGSRLGKNAVAKVPCYIQIEKRGWEEVGRRKQEERDILGKHTSSVSNREGYDYLVC